MIDDDHGVYIVFAYDDAYRFPADDQIIGVFKTEISAYNCFEDTKKTTTFSHVRCECFKVDD